MRLLILGGSGFVSGCLTEKALKAGHEVWCVTRGNKPLRNGVHSVIADRNDGDALRTALKKTGVCFDAVLDCICFNAEQAETSLRVLPAFSKRIVVVSTDSVYHPFHKAVPQNEDASVYLADGGYGARKREMEEVFIRDGGKRMRYTLFRPGHIFGFGSKLGCYPEVSRRDDTVDLIRAGKPLPLVGGGEFLIHPVYAGDLCDCMLAAVDNEKTFDRIFCIGGPDIIPNAEYYRILGRLLGTEVTIGTIPLEGYLDAHPECSGHLCHRAYDLTRLKEAGLPLPSTHLEDGLREQLVKMGVL
ncbi:MAG: NAD-dependent dehydratase [Clostridiales bacterium]|nr:NAD-dependent dehydratase [Clostridiales bacterium]